ncbi:hypothetical protein LINPERHAP1_LOCUS8120 [Linum perenne]
MLISKTSLGWIVWIQWR